MHIAVLIKQIPSPEAAFSMFRIDEHALRVTPMPGVPLVMSPFDEQAMEAALRIRESRGEAKITAVSIGPDSARNALKHALAMGADEAVLVTDAASAVERTRHITTSLGAAWTRIQFKVTYSKCKI